MELIKQIGRYEFSVLSVIAVIKQADGTYDVMLPHGVKLNLTQEEKDEYTSALQLHNEIMQVYGMCKAHGLRG